MMDEPIVKTGGTPVREGADWSIDVDVPMTSSISEPLVSSATTVVEMPEPSVIEEPGVKV